jgi:hypothetical protein
MAGQEIASFYATIGADTKDFKKGLDDAKTGMGGLEKSANAMGTALKVGIGLGVTAIVAFVAVVGDAVSAAADFEQGLTDIGATMGLSAEETTKLQDHIMDLGLDPELKVSASEATDAIMALGTAGLSLTELMGGASEATVLLSNATGGAMGDSASLLTDIMSQFNITAEESGRIVDQVTGLTVASKFAFGDAALAISQAGGMAGATGVEFEDFNAILGVTAANFSSGSDAGTSLKTFLTTLVPKSVEAAGVMRDLGLFTGLTGKEFENTQNKIAKIQERISDLDPTSKNFGDRLRELQEEQRELSATLVEGSNAFFDSNGNMKSAEEIATLLQTAFGGLTEERKNDAAATIFGNDAMRTAFGLMKAGEEGVISMKAEIGKVDAEELAATRMDTFAGSMEIAQGIMETLQISIGQKFLPVLRPLVDKFSELATKYGPQVITFFGDMAARMTDALNVGIDWATRVIPPLWKGFIDITSAIGKMIKPITDLVGDWVKWQDVLLVVGAFLIGPLLGMVGAATVALVQLAAPIVALVVAVAALRKAWETDFGGIRTDTLKFFMGFTEWVKTYTGIWKGDWGKTMDFFRKSPQEAFTIMWDRVKETWRVGVRDIKHVISVWIEDVTNKFEAWYSKTYFGIRSWMVRTIRVFEDLKSDAIELMDRLFGWFKPNEWIQMGRDVVQGLWDGAREIWNRFKSWWDGIWGNDVPKTVDVKMEMGSPSKLMERYGKWTMEGFAIGAEDALPMVTGAMDKLVASTREAKAAAKAAEIEDALAHQEKLDALARLGLNPNYAIGSPIPSAAETKRPVGAGANSELGHESAVLTLLQAILNELRRGSQVNVNVQNGGSYAGLVTHAAGMRS